MDPVRHQGLGRPGGHTLLERGGASAAGLALVLLCAIVAVNVITRALWVAVIPDDILLVSELMLIVILGPVALVTADREHIAVTIFTDRAGQGAKRALSCLAQLAGLAFFGFLLAAFWELLLKAWRTGEYYDGILDIPQWPGLALAVAAVAGVMLRLAWLLFVDFRRLGLGQGDEGGDERRGGEGA